MLHFVAPLDLLTTFLDTSLRISNMADWDEPAATTAASDAPEIKLFGKWSSSDVSVSDISLNVSLFLSSFTTKVPNTRMS